MFERYSEKARRTIFFARYEASQTGGPMIEPAHILLGLLRENKALFSTFLETDELRGFAEEIRQAIAQETRLPTSTEMPLSAGAKVVLDRAFEEAENMNSPAVTPQHLLIALLRDESGAAARKLAEKGITAARVRAVDIPVETRGEIIDRQEFAPWMSGPVAAQIRNAHAAARRADKLAKIALLLAAAALAVAMGVLLLVVF